jgi:diguanylate cyclase (GGDEF)-like protein/putative nucleotidyltransferase with HDIG domain
VRPRKRELRQRLSAAETRIAELEDELTTRILRDPLTGLHSAQGFAKRLDAEVERCRRYGRDLAVAALDIDGFHAVNAAHGHEVGDEVLKAVAAMLSRQTRLSDVVCRSSADQFLVLLPETSTPASMQAFERILLAFERIKVGPVEAVSASVGIAEWRRPMTSGQLISVAEERMRGAREAGGARAEAMRGPEKSARELSQDAIAGLAEALVERDRYTGEHSEFVVNLSISVARGLALGDRDVEMVKAAALLHDIGKVAIPDKVLHKRGLLDELEWAVMREHPVIGERILRAIPGLGPVARIVRHEHERWDGEGYPDGLAGDQIPIAARIILACDAYHAMTSDRPYRKRIPHANAIRELAANAGTQFDPQVTEILIGLLYNNPRVTAGAAA